MHETERAENRIQTENKGGTRHTETEDNKNSETVAWKTREEIMGIATRKKKMVGGEKNRKLKKKKKIQEDEEEEEAKSLSIK